MVAGNYDTPYIIKVAAEKVGNFKDMDAIIKAIEKNEFPGASGIIKWTDDHNYVWGYPYFVDLACGQYQGPDDVVVIYPIKFNAEDYGRKPVGESVPAVGWQY